MIRIWVYIWASYSFASVLSTKWSQWYFYFWPFHLSSSPLPLCTGPTLASAQIIRLDAQFIQFTSPTYSGPAHSPWRYPLRRNRGLGFWPPPPEGGRSSHRGLLLLEPMRFHRLNWRQHVHNWSGFALWWEVWWEVEGCVHPSQHSTSSMVTMVSLGGRINAGLSQVHDCRQSRPLSQSRMAPSGIQRLRAKVEASLSHPLLQCFYHRELTPTTSTS